MAKKKRKRNPLKANAKRQAHASLKGYLYQIWHSVNAWLDLADDDILYLEGAEDFDTISDDTATATQVKDTQRSITLRSQDVNDAINHYWKLRDSHPELTVKFRFLTRSKVGVERGNPFEKGRMGLQVWSRCSGNEVAITKISKFLQDEGKISDEVKDFLRQTEPQEIYKKLIEPITWETDSKPASFVERSINDKLVLHGNRQPIPIQPFAAKKVVDRLLKEALMVATEKENRKLTKVRFLEIFEEQTTRRVPDQWIQYQQMLGETRSVGAEFIGGSSDTVIQSYPHIQTGIPPLYLDVVIPRSNLLTEIQTKLESDGIVVIQGGVDTGKTILAKLASDAIDGDWFWRNFTNKETSQIVQDLQQLAIVISNQSSQVNVVLDDLNLQPQQLKMYEEELGIVAYRVLERCANLLITSQYNPPNNFIRSLGFASSVVARVPHFTSPEIEQFAAEMGCPAEHAKVWAEWVQVHTKGHPRLVHARLTQLQQEAWEYQGKIESILQTPQEVVKEREEARQLLMGLSEDQRKFLYRLSLLTEFRRDYSLNIGEIPEPIPDPGDVFSQLVGPWIDQVSETYYTISPLLTNAANEVWSKNKISELHAEVANAILKANNLTTIEAHAVLTHSMFGENKEGFISVIYALMTAPEDSWKMLSQEFSWLRRIKIAPHEELFPGESLVNHCFRSLQYRIAVEVEPEFAPKILEIWDKETKPHEPNQPDPLSRIMLTTRVLMYHQVLLPAKQMVDYLKEMIDITNNHKELKKIYDDFVEQVKKYKTDKSNFFSILFGFIYARRPIYSPFLSDLIDALDELHPNIRTLLLADFEDDTIDSRILIDGIWRSEADLENPDWTRCLQVFDKVIERTIAWDYPHIAAASARGKAIIYDEYLDDRDTAHKALQEIISKVGPLPIIEEEQAFIYFHQERYKEALNIYERILPEWNPPSRELLDVIPLEAHRRAAMCAAHLGDWKKAATFFEDGVTRTQNIESPEKQIGLYADAGFAYFKAGNMFNCIRLLHLALQNFEMLSQDNTDIKYFTLKKRLGHTITWIKTIWYESEDNSPKLFEPSVGFCSDPETKEEYLSLPDCPTGYAWLHLSQIEYRFGHETTVFQHALQTTDRKEYPILNFFLSCLEAQYEFRNKTFDNLPQRIYQLALVYSASKKHQQSGKGAAEKGSYSISDSDLSGFASVENITIFFISTLLTQLSINRDVHEVLSLWRTNSLQLSIKENILTALDLIESILFGDYNQAVTVMKTENTKVEKQLAASLRVVLNKEKSLENLFYAHTFIASYFFDLTFTWLDPVMIDFGKLLSVQWLEKIKNGAMWEININTVQQIEQACTSSEAGKIKISQILLAAYPVVTTIVDPRTLQKFRTCAESESKQRQEPERRKNPAAQRLIKAMEKPPHLTDEDIEVLNQSIKEGEIPIKFDSPFDSDETKK